MLTEISSIDGHVDGWPTLAVNDALGAPVVGVGVALESGVSRMAASCGPADDDGWTG